MSGSSRRSGQAAGLAHHQNAVAEVAELDLVHQRRHQRGQHADPAHQRGGHACHAAHADPDGGADGEHLVRTVEPKRDCGQPVHPEVREAEHTECGPHHGEAGSAHAAGVHRPPVGPART
ncbi:hypothetical protein ACKFRZ_11060 [Corynebacterium gottingense]|uniref:hypothetical protein n=1 Tax=Corynebacterium gottingense TaxID=2041036 RepID=UPI0038D123A8